MELPDPCLNDLARWGRLGSHRNYVEEEISMWGEEGSGRWGEEESNEEWWEERLWMGCWRRDDVVPAPSSHEVAQ